jgi:glycosyltransferase involved in cell wall biosynthesis
MRIVHVTPHLPPDQAANALLPFQLGEWAHERGDSVAYIAHPPRAGKSASLAGPATWIPRSSSGPLQRWLRLGSVTNAWRIWRRAARVIAKADLVHVHSNGLLSEACAWLAARQGRPVVLTLYGTEIWHYQPGRWPDLFTRAYRSASVVTFYSDQLLLRARELGLGRRDCQVIYPPVADAFTYHDEDAQLDMRRSLGLTARHILLNVKRLHPLAGQRFLVEAMREVVREFPDARLIICGTGALLAELQAVARSAGVERHVTFAGLLDNSAVARYCAAADLFVLPSILEALPTVALEALACGTPVLSSDNPGGLELSDVFGDDVAVVPREQVEPLGDAIKGHLRRKRRTLPATRATIQQRFRPAAVASRYWAAYAAALEHAHDRRAPTGTSGAGVGSDELR